MKPSLILIGGGGHCKSVIDVIEAEDRYSIEGILDQNQEGHAGDVCSYPILGDDELIGKLIEANYHFLITVGQIKDNAVRVNLYGRLMEMKATLATVISPYAVVSKNAQLGEGSVIMHQSVINSGVKTGVNVIVNTGAILEHDSIVGDHSHISTGTIVNADCTIGSRCFIGSNSTVNRGLSIGADTIVGSSSLVTKDLKEPGTYYGIPIKSVDP